MSNPSNQEHLLAPVHILFKMHDHQANEDVITFATEQEWQQLIAPALSEGAPPMGHDGYFKGQIGITVDPDLYEILMERGLSFGHDLRPSEIKAITRIVTHCS